jgi:hypothetical protein
MANILNVLDYALADMIRQRSNAEKLAHMNVMGAYSALGPAQALAHGREMNVIKGTASFTAAAARQGMVAVSMGTASPLFPGERAPTIVTAVPAPPARKRQQRARK